MCLMSKTRSSNDLKHGWGEGPLDLCKPVYTRQK